MKHSTKTTLWAALVLFVSGVLLTTVCLIVSVATEADLFGNNSREYNFKTEQYAIHELLSTCGANETDTITEFSFTLNTADLKIVPTGGESHLELVDINLSDYTFSYSGGTFSLTEAKPVNRFGFYIENNSISFGGLRHLFHKPATKALPQIILHWNKADTLSAVRANLTVGTINAEALPENAGLFISLTYGNTVLQNCRSENRALDVRTTIGDITLEDCAFETAALNTTCGTVSISSANCKNLQANTVVGTILVNTEKTPSQIHANTTLGTITLPNGSSVGTSYNRKNDSDSSAHLTVTVGDIHLN